jgi:hypothetical protein
MTTSEITCTSPILSLPWPAHPTRPNPNGCIALGGDGWRPRMPERKVEHLRQPR